MTGTPTRAELRAGVDLASAAEELLELARRAGADEAEVAASSERRAGVRFEEGEARSAEVDRSLAIGLRVFVDRRLGFVSTNQLDRPALARAAEEAVALARSSPRDEANLLPLPRSLSREPAPLDGEIEHAGVAAVVERAIEFVAGVRSIDRRLSIDRASVEARSGRFLLRATNGLAVEQSDAYASGSVFGMAVDGGDVGGFDARGTVARRLSDLASRLEREGRRFAETALGNLGAGAAETYRGPVLLSPEAFRAMLLAPLVAACSAIAVQRGRSRLADRLGSLVADRALEVADDPTDEDLAGATVFDREGQPADRFTLVGGGELRAFYFNGYAAAVGGHASTGHATGGARSSPGLGLHALVVAGGDGGTVADLQRRLGRGLFVQRFSGTVDASSGDFSGVAKSARWIEGGEVARAVREVSLAGNAFDALAGSLVLATTPERLGGAERIPAALADGISVTAG